TNTFLIGRTIRATDNFFKETIGSGAVFFTPVSLDTTSDLFNNTSNNQGDHCIFARTGGANLPINDNNQIVDDSNCPRLSEIFATVMSTFTLAGPISRD